MRKLLLILGLPLLGITGLQAQEKFKVVGQECLGTGMSPNGKYVVGVSSAGTLFNAYPESYLYKVESEEQEWLTKYDETDLGKTGNFTDVTDEGIIAGFFKDPAYQITSEGSTFPVNVAAIWKNGQVTSLGIGDFELSEYKQFYDGSFAEAISNDGETVVGYIGLQNATFYFPCKWELDQANDKWEFSKLNFPADAVGGKATDVSADGSIIAGTVWYKGKEAAAYWKDGECHLILGTGEDVTYNEDTYRNGAHTVSPNGKYIAFDFDGKVPAIFDLESQTYKKVETYDNKSVEKLAVSDDGDLVGAYTYGHLMMGSVYRRPFWYSYKDDKTFGFDYFMSLFAPGVVPPFTFLFEEKTVAFPCAVSADGSVVMGNNDVIKPLGGIPQNWVLCAKKQEIEIPEALEQVQARSMNLKEVTVSWEKEKRVYDDLTLQAYTVYCDGQKIADVTDDGSEHLSYVQTAVTPGFRMYSVASVFKAGKTGALIESSKSEPVTVAVADTYALPLYDDFDSGTTETNYWTKELQTGDLTEGGWNPIVYCGLVDKGLYVGCTSAQPYSSTFTSRPLDATRETNVSLSFAIAYMFVNSDKWPLDKDSLSIEVTVDKGDTWTEVKTYSLGQIPRVYGFLGVDLSPWVSGKLFQVRLRKHGQGAAQFTYTIDIFKVSTTPEKEAPTGLAGTGDKKQVNLIWKNSGGSYQLSYQTGRGDKVIGDENKPFIAVNAFDAKDLEKYKGKYLTSIRAFVNHETNYEDSKDTHVSVVVFEDGKLIREQEMESIEYNEANTVILKEPVLIDATKELKIGMKIFDYDERQMPVTYQNTLDYIAGKSDLYSQDNGKTWKKLSDFFGAIEGKETDGYGCWEITGQLTDEPTVGADVATDQDLYAYNVYRNGDQLNKNLIYCESSHFTDSEPLDNATYEVIAYYLDGSVSEVSLPFAWESGSNITAEQADYRVVIYPNPATDYLTLNGEFERATLYSLKGETVKMTQHARIDLTGLAEGMYLLKVESRNSIENHKVMIKR